MRAVAFFALGATGVHGALAIRKITRRCGPAPAFRYALATNSYTGIQSKQALQTLDDFEGLRLRAYDKASAGVFAMLGSVPNVWPVGLSRRRQTPAHCWSARLRKMIGNSAERQSPDNVSSGSTTVRRQIRVSSPAPVASRNTVPQRLTANRSVELDAQPR